MVKAMTNNVVASWKESIALLEWKNLKLLLLVSLKSLFEVYRSLLYAWYFPLMLFLGLVLSMPSLVAAFYTTLIVRAARPSIEKKNHIYWQHFVFADWVVFLGIFVLVQVPIFMLVLNEQASTISQAGLFIYKGFLELLFLTFGTWLPGDDALGVMLYFLAPFTVIWILFMFDARVSVWQYILSIWRALLMTIANYPLLFIVYSVFRLLIAVGFIIARLFVSYYEPLALIGWVVLYALIFPFYICFITNIYIKRLHEQFQLYYSV